LSTIEQVASGDVKADVAEAGGGGAGATRHADVPARRGGSDAARRADAAGR